MTPRRTLRPSTAAYRDCAACGEVERARAAWVAAVELDFATA